MKHILSLSCALVMLAGTTFAAPQRENLGRGLVAVKVSSGVYLSWRLLATDSYHNTSFNLYRDGTLLTTIAPDKPTCYTDATGTTTSSYEVKAVLRNVEESRQPATITPWAQQSKVIQLQRPPAGITPPNVENGGTSSSTDVSYPEGQSYTYTPNDCSVGDLDGDGEYEIIVKWDPSNSKDNSQTGITGNVYIDAYKLDGTFLWRIDLGRNIRAGAHYTQFLVYDFDGDGKAEMICKTAPGTKDGAGNNVIMGSDNPDADYRYLNISSSGSSRTGFVLQGPEYLTLFDGATGAELHTVAFEPARGTVSSWGDSYGNRVDRFLACVANLSGTGHSAVMCRGYYARLTMAAYDVVNKRLVRRWLFDSSTSGYSAAAGQGNHNLSVADVDDDGRDEIIYGACAINDNGTLMYTTGLGHGDAMHLSDLDPDRPGLEVWEVHEETGSGKWDYEMHDARTGTVIWKSTTYATDNGRGLAADIDTTRGFEMWSSSGTGIYSCKGTRISTAKPTINFRMYWDGDLQDELLDGNKIDKWNGSGTTRLVSFSGSSVNGTKANPCISGDILGDWREEVVLYSASNPSQIIIYTTTIPTTHRLPTLMHDHVYRMGIAWQNVSYNQPPHLSYYLPDGIEKLKNEVEPEPQPEPVLRKVSFTGVGLVAWDIAVLDSTPAPIPTTPRREGYDFVAWLFNGATWNFTSIVTEDITLVAQWAVVIPPVVRKVSFIGEGLVAWDTTVLDSTLALMPATPQREGYDFVAWLLNGATWDFASLVTEDITLVAQWYKLPPPPQLRTVSFIGKDIVAWDTTVLDSTLALMPATPQREGYDFVAWRLNGTAWDFATLVTEDITLIAQWAETPVTTAIGELALRTLELFPNPLRDGMLHVKIPAGQADVKVYASSGALVYARNFAAGTATLNLSQLPAGTYVVRCGAYAAKIVVVGK